MKDLKSLIRNEPPDILALTSKMGQGRIFFVLNTIREILTEPSIENELATLLNSQKVFLFLTLNQMFVKQNLKTWENLNKKTPELIPFIEFKRMKPSSGFLEQISLEKNYHQVIIDGSLLNTYFKRHFQNISKINRKFLFLPEELSYNAQILEPLNPIYLSFPIKANF